MTTHQELISSKGFLQLTAEVQARDEAQAGRGQAEATKADNLALVERLKYVQGYQAQPRTRKRGSLSATSAC